MVCFRKRMKLTANCTTLVKSKDKNTELEMSTAGLL